MKTKLILLRKFIHNQDGDEQIAFIKRLLTLYISVFSVTLVTAIIDLPKVINVQAENSNLLSKLNSETNNPKELDNKSKDTESSNILALLTNNLPVQDLINRGTKKVKVVSELSKEESIDHNLVLADDVDTDFSITNQNYDVPFNAENVFATINNSNNVVDSVTRIVTGGAISSRSNQTSASAKPVSAATQDITQAYFTSSQNQIVTSEYSPEAFSTQSSTGLLDEINNGTGIANNNTAFNAPSVIQYNQSATIDSSGYNERLSEFTTEQPTGKSTILEPITPGSITDPIVCPPVERYFPTPEQQAAARALQLKKGCA